jgi:GNAT superfamily N-acetyltransferase
MLLAWVDLVGYVALEKNEVAELFVAPACHGQGIGTLLFRLAEEAIRKSGFAIIQLKGTEADLDQALHLLLEGLGYESSPPPIFEAAERPAHRCTTLTIPGILARRKGEENGNRLFLSFVPLNGNIVYFLYERDIRVVFVADAVR